METTDTIRFGKWWSKCNVLNNSYYPYRHN